MSRHALLLGTCVQVALVSCLTPFLDPGARSAPLPTSERMLLHPDRSLQRPVGPQLATVRVPVTKSGPFRPTGAPSLDGSPVEYLILTSEAMRPSFERLAEWKTAKGVPAVVRTMSQIENAGFRGSDLAETVRMYIRDAYLYWGVRFVLLGGDTDVLPARYVKMEFLGLEDPVTDLYFACLDGSWNADRDAFFGEPFENSVNTGDDADFVAEVFLGRAPVSTPSEADLFVDKILSYEKPVDLDYQDRLLLAAEVLFPQNYVPGEPISIDGATFAEYIHSQFLPPSIRTTRRYESYELYTGPERLTLADFQQEINSGYGTVVHIGHGFRYTLSVGDGRVTVGEASDFVNGSRSGLFYMLNCTAAAYDFESLAEALLLNPNGGASLVLGSAREAFPMAARDYQYEFFRQLFELDNRRVGEAMVRSREEFVNSTYHNTVDRWTQLGYTLLGDPEVSIWGAPPTALQLEGLPATLQVGSQVVSLVVRDATGPVPGALVCAQQTGVEYRVARADAAGNVQLQLEPTASGTLDFTVTAFDHLPLETNRPVVTPTRAFVLAGMQVTDDGAQTGDGNLDGVWDAGETISLDIRLRNVGTVPYESLQVTLASTDPAIVIEQAQSAYPDLSPGEESDPSTPFVVRAFPETADGEVVLLQLELQHKAGTETRRVEILVRAARVGLVSLRLDDVRAGNGDGVPDPNEEVDLYYTVQNLGNGTAQDVEIRLSALEGGLEVLQGTSSVGSLLPGTRVESPTPITVRESDPSGVRRGQLAVFDLQHPTGADRFFDLAPPSAPSPPTFVTADQVDAVHLEWPAVQEPDLLGYRILRSDSPTGPFVGVSSDVVQHAYFRDRGLLPSTRYYYSLVAVDTTLLESGPSGVASVSTNPPQAPGWPLTTSNNSSSTIAVGDVNGDGRPDLVAGSRQLFAWDGSGVELLDADGNALSWGLFYGRDEAFGSVTLAALDSRPGQEVVAATWDAENRYVVVVGGDGQALPGWPQPMVPEAEAFRGVQVPPVVANLDQIGAPEILVAARDGRLYGWHADGTEIADGDSNPSTHGVLFDTASRYLRSAPGVADLDPQRPGLEIVFGDTKGALHVLDAWGRPLPGWPRTTFGEGIEFGALFTGGVSIADLDRDGMLEFLVIDDSRRLHAMHLDGSELPGFPVPNIRAWSEASGPSPAIGNLTGDANLEIVVVSTNGYLHLLDATGQQLFPGGAFHIGAGTQSSPILGDVDGDPEIEIVIGNEKGVLGAWNLDGSSVDGFPISLRAEVRGTPTLADIDADGETELALVSWDGIARVWKLGVPWVESRYPWPTFGASVHRTGEYGYDVPTPVTSSDLRAEWIPRNAVRIAWHAASTGSTVPFWRVRRGGPFASNPLAGSTLGGTPDFDYTSQLIGEIRGIGELEVLDPHVQPGSWYVYILGLLDERLGGEAEEMHAGTIAVETALLPGVLRFLPDVPNPFRPGTRFRFEIPARAGTSRAEVRLTLFDARGRRVRRLVQSALAPGVHDVVWDGRDEGRVPVASGVYVARVEAWGGSVTRKITLVH